MQPCATPAPLLCASGPPTSLTKISEPPRGARYSQAAILARRRSVFEMVVLKGFSTPAVAKALAVSPRTVAGDLAALREAMKGQSDGCDVQAEIGLQAAKFERLAQLALQEMGAAKSPMERAALMGQALRAMDLRIRLLQRTGLLPSAPRRVETTVSSPGGPTVDYSTMPLPELLERRDRLLASLAASKGSPVPTVHQPG
jgi:transposase